MLFRSIANASNETNRRRITRRLEFVHIPKTGGTVIEAIAGRVGVRWSMCHFVSPEKAARMSANTVQCPSLSSDNAGGIADNTYDDSRYFDAWKNASHCYDGTSWWHLPPAYFFKYANNNDTTDNTNNSNCAILPTNPYEDADLFTVVRNPYDRIISEYYYRHSFGPLRRKVVKNKVNLQDVDYFNQWIATELERFDDDPF